jgi:hypothetical protein
MVNYNLGHKLQHYKSYIGYVALHLLVTFYWSGDTTVDTAYIGRNMYTCNHISYIAIQQATGRSLIFSFI